MIIFEGLSLNQIKKIFLEGESPTLRVFSTRSPSNEPNNGCSSRLHQTIWDKKPGNFPVNLSSKLSSGTYMFTYLTAFICKTTPNTFLQALGDPYL